MTENTIVDEVHEIRERLLGEYSGDLRALMKDAQRRTELALANGRMVASAPPPHPMQPSAAKKVG